MRTCSRLRSKLRKYLLRGYLRFSSTVLSKNAALFVAGTMLLIGGLADISQADKAPALYEEWDVALAVGLLFRLIEGAFGALIMTISGLGAIIAASMGAYRAAMGMLVVAVGAFILRALVSLFFGSFPDLSLADAGGWGRGYAPPSGWRLTSGGDGESTVLTTWGGVSRGGWNAGGAIRGSSGSIGGSVNSNGGWTAGGVLTGSSGSIGMAGGSSGGRTSVGLGGTLILR